MTNPFDDLLEIVESAMADGAPSTPRELIQNDIAQRLSSINNELDGLIALSRDFDSPDIQDAICAEEKSFWAAMTKAQLICSFIDARKPTGLRLVRGTQR